MSVLVGAVVLREGLDMWSLHISYIPTHGIDMFYIYKVRCFNISYVLHI